MLLPPSSRHCALREEADTSKYSITFGLSRESPLWESLEPLCGVLTGEVPAQIPENLRCIREEWERRDAYFDTVICSRVWECVLGLLRLAGVKERASAQDLSASEEDARLLLAKQYIEDNICRPITVPELSAYCAIGEKQLTRLFLQGEGIPVAEYVRRARFSHIEHLLADTALSLRDVSERMNFNNEYYFNAFFKKQSGMSPGAYRRSVLKK